ncbi:MAG: efflux transporter outer membrane subunit [Caulobacteraceae bacterium]|nr:efflux transporter outer membrane subunit [Caulobacteraceae bacterium]
MVRACNVAKRAPVALAGALALALASCKTVGPDFHSPAPPTDAGYLGTGDVQSPLIQAAQDHSGAGGWWKALGSAKLDGVMDEALAGNRTLAEANANLERVRAQAAVTRGAQAPQADFSAGPQGQRINVQSLGFTGFPNPTIFLYNIGGAVTFDFDLFGRLRRTTEAAEARAEEEADRTDAAYLTLTGQTAMAALQIAATRAQIDAVTRAVANDERLIDLTRRAFEAGGQPRSAVDSLLAQLAQDQTQLAPLQQQLAQARHSLAMLVGRTPATWAVPDFELADFSPPAGVPVSLPSRLVRRRPDILAAEAELHAATAEVGAATADLYPDIKLTASITQTTITPSQIFTYAASGWNVAGNLTQPIFHGGALKARKAAAEADARAVLARYQQTVISAFVQVADVMQAIANDEAELAALDRSEAAATQTQTDAELSFRIGGGALFPVIDAERQLSLIRRSRATTQARHLADIAQLFVATAADWRAGRPAERATGAPSGAGPQ